MLNKVSEYVRRNALLTPGQKQLAAVSGGADSVALLLILQQLGYRVETVHCNFHLRGEESNRDEQFVAELCKHQGIELHLIHFDTVAYASLHKVSIEMAARELRYRYFEQLRQDIGAENVCVAHHSDDAVETLLMNLLRGTGIHGLTGIRPRNGHVVRPLLNVSRRDIEIFLDSIGQRYVTDSTNLQNDVLRNKIRLDLLPVLKSINPKASENLCRTARSMAEAERVFESAMESAKSRVTRHDGSLDIGAIRQEPSPEYLLFEILTPLGFSPDTVRQIAARVDGLTAPRPDGDTGVLYSSATHDLVIDRGSIVVEERGRDVRPVVIPEPGTYAFGDRKVRVELSSDVSVSRQASLATLDADGVVFPLTVRATRSGDRFVPFGMEGSRLVSDFLTDRKVNLLRKRRQLVVADASGRILWLVGQRTDNRFRVTGATRSVLRITTDSTDY